MKQIKLKVSKIPIVHFLVVATGTRPLEPVGVMANGQEDWGLPAVYLEEKSRQLKLRNWLIPNI